MAIILGGRYVMKVIFECEECGREYGEVDGLTTGTQTTREKIVDAMRRFEREGCPACAKPTYGTITQDMMAEALCECSHSHDDVEDDYYECEARFVLRLLIDGGLANDKPTVTRECTAEDWRCWLLDMARQK